MRPETPRELTIGEVLGIPAIVVVLWIAYLTWARMTYGPREPFDDGADIVLMVPSCGMLTVSFVLLAGWVLLLVDHQRPGGR